MLNEDQNSQYEVVKDIVVANTLGKQGFENIKTSELPDMHDLHFYLPPNINDSEMTDRVFKSLLFTHTKSPMQKIERSYGLLHNMESLSANESYLLRRTLSIVLPLTNVYPNPNWELEKVDLKDRIIKDFGDEYLPYTYFATIGFFTEALVFKIYNYWYKQNLNYINNVFPKRITTIQKTA